MLWKFAIIIIASYFLGNVHFARILSRAKNDDITKHGSGNPGTMNMLRTHGIIFGVFTLLLDGLKGAIPALLAYLWLGGADGGLMATYAMHIAGLFAVLGHVFPVVYRFKGGKGVATAFGFFTVVNPLVSFILFVIGLIVFVTIKIGSVSSLVYISLFVLYQVITNFNTNSILPLTILLAVGVLIVVVHKTNVKKLVKKQENKINFNEVMEKDKELIQKNKEAIMNKIKHKK